MKPSFAVRRAFSGRIQPRLRSSSPFRAHSSTGPHVHKSLVYHPQLARRKLRHQIRRFLGQPPVLNFRVAELPPDDPNRIFSLGPYAGLVHFQKLQDYAYRVAFFHGPALVWHHCYVLVHVGVMDQKFFALLHTPVPRVGKNVGYFIVELCTSQRFVVCIGRLVATLCTSP